MVRAFPKVCANSQILQEQVGIIRFWQDCVVCFYRSVWEWSYFVGLGRVSAEVCGCGQRCCRGVGLAGVCVVVHGRSQLPVCCFFYWCSSIVIKILKSVCWLTGEYLQLQYWLFF